MTAPDVLVVGGGVVGCSVAFHLAREGISVTLLERDDLAGGASGIAAGMLTPLAEAEPGTKALRLALRSLATFPALCAELLELSGIDPEYLASGRIEVAQSVEEAAHLAARPGTLEGHGLEWLDEKAARNAAPGLAEDVVGALWSPNEGHVRSPGLARAFAGAAQRLGATVELGAPVVGLEREGDRIVGVRTASGPRAAGGVVLATGVWSGATSGLPFPIEPVRGQIVSLESEAVSSGAILWSRDAYLVPKRDGTLVLGATVERVGFDRRVTARGVQELLVAGGALVPALGLATFLSAWAGLRPDTPDHRPLVGAVPETEGLWVAAGHFRSGVLLSPVTGEIVRDGILGKGLPADAEAFAPGRFAQ